MTIQPISGEPGCYHIQSRSRPDVLHRLEINKDGILCGCEAAMARGIKNCWHVEQLVNYLKEMKKVLFLDVDGVLNHRRTKERCLGYLGVEMAKCRLVARIVQETNADVVLCSTWRKHPEMLAYLWPRLGEGVHSRYIGNTPVLESKMDSGLYSGYARGDEIAAWLSENPHITKFAILDDDGDMCHLIPHLVQTDMEVGVTEELANEVIKRLNS